MFHLVLSILLGFIHLSAWANSSPMERTWIFLGNGHSAGCGPFRDDELHYLFDVDRIAQRGSRSVFAFGEETYRFSIFPDERCRPEDPVAVRGSSGELIRWCMNESEVIEGEARVEGSRLTLIAHPSAPKRFLYGTDIQNFNFVIRQHDDKEILELSFESAEVARSKFCGRSIRIYEYFLPFDGT